VDIGAVSLLFQEKGFDATMAKVAALDAAGAKVGAKAVEVRVSSPTASVVQAALAQVGETATQVSSRPVTLRFALAGLTELSSALGTVEQEKTKAGAPVVVPVTAPNIAPAVAALAAIEAEKAKAGSPLTIPVAPPATVPVVAALGQIEAAEAAVAAPVAVTVVAPNVVPTTAALGAVEAEKAVVATPVTPTVLAPNVAPALGALGAVETEQAAVSAPVTTTVVPPNVAPTTAALAGVEAAKAAVATPATVTVVAPNVAAATAALAGVDGAKAEVAAPVTVTVAPPNVAPAVAALEGLEAEKTTVGPALAALSALAEAEAAQISRLAALSAALTEFGAGSGKTAQERALGLQSAVAADTRATEQLSGATRALSIAERDGAEITRLRTQALNEFIAAQRQATREAQAASTTRGASANTQTPTVGPAPLGPAPLQTAALPQRAQATAAAFMAQTAATQQATAALAANTQIVQQATTAQTALAGRVVGSANAATALSPKLRSAANGLTAVAFAATASGGSFQSMALGAGLAAQSLASMATGPVALWASGIGAAVVVGVAIIGILDRMAERAANTKTAFAEVNKEIAQFTHVSEAEAELTKQTRKLAEAQAALDAATRNALAGGSAGALSLGADIATIAVLQKVVERGNDLVEAARKKRGALELRDTEQLQAARLGIITQATAAENQRWEAASQAFLATEQAKFALGQRSLDQFFDRRLAAIQTSGAREIAALKERQSLLAEPVADATPAESAKRAAEIKALGAEIAAVEARTREETTRTTEERRQQREALNKAVIAFEQREQDAAGDASEARIAAAKREAIEIARTLVQQSDPKTPEEFAKAYADANARAQQFVATQTAIIRTQQAQNQAAREFAALGLEREAIQRRLERGEITQAQAEQEIAAVERARIPALIEIAAKMEQFATALSNPDLLAAAKRLRGEIEGMARTPLGPLAQQVKSVLDQLSVEAREGNRGSAQLLKELQAEIDANGEKITVGIAVKAQWAKQIKDEIEAQGALLEILIKPKNIVLSGVEQALGNLNQQLGGLATNIGDSLGGALASGFSSAFTKGSGKNFFEAAGNAILAGIGDTLVRLGSAMLTYGLLMSVAAPFFLAAGVFTKQAISAPAAIVAGTGLIALGAGLGAIAANNTGTRTGGASGSRGSNQSAQIPTQQVVLDPDRRLREAREVAPKPTVNATARAAPSQQPFVFAPTIIGTSDPKAQRDIATMVEAAARRGLVPSLG
jgi:hypothetical protein